MKTVVGLFQTAREADRAAQRVHHAGIPLRNLNLFYPGDDIAELQAAPQTAGEQPGMGKALGAVVGGATGAAAGFGLPALVSLAVPGIGPVLAIGTAAAALLGVGGAVGGAVAGAAIEDSLTEGLPTDEVYLYADALRKGRSIVVALVETDDQEKAAQEAMAGAGAESIDAAREQWWVGLRDAEKEHYSASGHDFDTDEMLYRKGFEAALNLRWMDRSYDAARADLRTRYGPSVDESSFRRGFERGHRYSLDWHREAQVEAESDRGRAR